MKVQDLRIGNLVYSTSHKAITKVIKLDFDSELLNIEPIQLTEEWFDKLSEEEFEFVGFGTRVIYQHKKHRAIKYEFCRTEVVVYFLDIILGFKQFVHDWQNIHFALTKEELTL